MDALVSRKRRRLSESRVEAHAAPVEASSTPTPDTGEDSTDIKIAILLSLFPDLKQDNLLDILVSCDGSVEAASYLLGSQGTSSSSPPKKRLTSNSALGAQTSLSSHVLIKAKDGSVTTLSDNVLRRKPLSTKKGQTPTSLLPEDIAAYTPCTIIHNYLPTEQANALLVELLDEAKHFSRYEFQLFNRTVQSPHTASLYVSTPEEYQQHTSEYKYGGTYRSNVRQATPGLRCVSRRVQKTVNEAVQARIRDVYPDGKKLKYQSPKSGDRTRPLSIAMTVLQKMWGIIPMN